MNSEFFLKVPQSESINNLKLTLQARVTTERVTEKDKIVLDPRTSEEFNNKKASSF